LAPFFFYRLQVNIFPIQSLQESQLSNARLATVIRPTRFQLCIIPYYSIDWEEAKLICWVIAAFTRNVRYGMIYLLTAIGLTPCGSSTMHIYTQTIHRTTQSTQTIHRTTQLTNWEECGPCPVFASYTLAFALQLRKKHGQTSVRVATYINRDRNKTIYTSIKK
jgi:hypothetical protein